MTDSRLRLLLLSDEMEVGGTQRQIVEIARGLDPARFDVTVLYFLNRSFLVDQLEAAGVRVIEVPRRSKIDVGFVRRLAQVIREGRYHAMHCFSYSGEMWATIARLLMPRAERPPMISSVRGTYEWYDRKHWLIKRWVTRHSVAVIANSRQGANYACRHLGLPEGRIEVVYNGMRELHPDAAAAVRLRQDMAPAAGEVVALFVGRLVDHKNVPRLLTALAIARIEEPRLVLWLAGDGPLRAALQAQAERLGLTSPAVRFLGERNDAPALMVASDFVVLPSLREGLSNVILEAMACGRAVLATRVGGTPEAVDDGASGLLVDALDERALAQALVRLARDAQLREQLGAAGAVVVREKFSTAAMIRHSETHYVAAARSL